MGLPGCGSLDAVKHSFQQSEDAGGVRRVMRGGGDHVADKLKWSVWCCLPCQDFDGTGPGRRCHKRSQVRTEDVRPGFRVVEVFAIKQAGMLLEQTITIAGIQVRLHKVPEVFRVAPAAAVLPPVVPGDELEQGQTRRGDALHAGRRVAPDPHRAGSPGSIGESLHIQLDHVVGWPGDRVTRALEPAERDEVDRQRSLRSGVQQLYTGWNERLRLVELVAHYRQGESFTEEVPFGQDERGWRASERQGR